MPLTHQIGILYKNDVGLVKSITSNYSGNSEVNLEYPIPALQDTPLEIDLEFQVSKIQSLLLHADHDIVVKTNHSDNTADDTLALKGGIAEIWTKDHFEACPFSTNVSKIYVTSAENLMVANLTIRILIAFD
jgi:hypothetical protein